MRSWLPQCRDPMSRVYTRTTHSLCRRSPQVVDETTTPFGKLLSSHEMSTGPVIRVNPHRGIYIVFNKSLRVVS